MDLPIQKHWQLAPRAEEIDRVITEAGQIFELCQVQPRDRFGLVLLLREALANAIVHGCRCSPAGQVECRLVYQLGPGCPCVTIEVTDPGPGFDWRQSLAYSVLLSERSLLQNEPLPEKNRGLIIYAKYATSYQFNESGNRILLLRELEKGMGTNE